MSIKSPEFNFDEWKNLAESDPEQFEKKRKAEIEALIASAPLERQKRLQGLQWQIDVERDRSKNPMQACLKINKMMMDSVYGENGLLAVLKQQKDGNKTVEEKKSAVVMPFRRNQDVS